MALTDEQMQMLDNAVRFMQTKLMRIQTGEGETGMGAWFYEQWQEAGLTDEDVIDFYEQIISLCRAAVVEKLRQVKAEANEAGLTDEEWAALTAPEPESEEDPE